MKYFHPFPIISHISKQARWLWSNHYCSL